MRDIVTKGDKKWMMDSEKETVTPWGYFNMYPTGVPWRCFCSFGKNRDPISPADRDKKGQRCEQLYSEAVWKELLRAGLMLNYQTKQRIKQINSYMSPPGDRCPTHYQIQNFRNKRGEFQYNYVES